MRVLITTYPEKTHFLLMVPLAWALRTAGHDVRVAVQPTMVEHVTRAGLTAVPVGGDRHLWKILGRVPNWLGRETGWPAPYDAAQMPDDEVSWDYLDEGYRLQVGRWHKFSAVPMITDLVDFARRWEPDLVIWEATTYAGGIAAKACGAAHGRMLIGMDVFGATRAHHLRLRAGRPEGDRADPLGEWLAGYAERYHTAFSEDMVTGEFTVDQLPSSLGLPSGLDRVPMRYVPYGGPAAVPRWTWAGARKPRVALTMGLTVTDHDVHFPVGLQDLLDGLADLDIELVVTVPDAERGRLARIPANARLVSYVPLQALLPTCSAIIHHGGVGTLLTAAQNAVPQLVLPWDVDQPALAANLTELGAGLTVPNTAATGAIVRSALLRLLGDPSFRAGAERLRAEVAAMPAPCDVVPRLEALAAARVGG